MTFFFLGATLGVGLGVTAAPTMPPPADAVAALGSHFFTFLYFFSYFTFCFFNQSSSLCPLTSLLALCSVEYFLLVKVVPSFCVPVY